MFMSDFQSVLNRCVLYRFSLLNYNGCCIDGGKRESFSDQLELVLSALITLSHQTSSTVRAVIVFTHRVFCFTQLRNTKRI